MKDASIPAESASEARLLLSLRETATALGVCERTVAGLVATGEIPSVRIGRRRLVHREALETWLLARMQEQHHE